jgi:hypothetical protein
VRLGGKEMIVVQKFDTERRLLLNKVGEGSLYPRSFSEFDYNSARPTLVRGKGRP